MARCCLPKNCVEIFRISLGRRDDCRGLWDISELKSKRMMPVMDIVEKLEKYCICWMEIKQHQAPLLHNKFEHNQNAYRCGHTSWSLSSFSSSKNGKEYCSVSYLIYKEQNTLPCGIILKKTKHDFWQIDNSHLVSFDLDDPIYPLIPLYLKPRLLGFIHPLDLQRSRCQVI